MVSCVAVGLRSVERRADVSSFSQLRQSVTEIYISISATELPRAKVGMTYRKETSMLWTIFVILLVLWLLGFIGHFGGGLIHLLLVIAVIVLIINLVSGRRPL
jgi:hypothetical protein